MTDIPHALSPDRYGDPFYVGNQMVAICKDCSTRSSGVMVRVEDVTAHDAEAHGD